LVISRKIGDRHGEGTALFNMAERLKEIGANADAAARMQDALTIFVEIESPHGEKARAALDQMRQEP
jgi:hypothetical protein